MQGDEPMTTFPPARGGEGASGASRRSDALISLAVNLLGIVFIAGLAFYFGTALFDGVTAVAVAITGIFAACAVIVLAPDAGLLLWFGLAPFGRLFNLSMGRGLPDLSLTRIAAMVLLLVLLAQVAVGKRRLVRFDAVAGWGLAFLVAMSLSIAGSHFGLAGGIQNVFDLVAVPLLCYFFATNLLRKPQHLVWLGIMLALVAAALGVIAAREQLTNQPVLAPVVYRFQYGLHSVKVTSLFGAPATMALTLALPLPFILVGALHSRELGPRLLWYAAAAATGAGLLLTYVRAGWLAAVLGLVIVALFARTESGGRRGGLALVLLVLLLAGLATASGMINQAAIQERLQSERPIEYRKGAISVALEIAQREPVLGVGFDNFSDAGIAAGWRPLGNAGLPTLAPHNLFLYVLTSGGLVALMPLLGLVAAILLRLVRTLAELDRRAPFSRRRNWTLASLAMFLGYLLMANTFDALGAQYASMLLFLILGATFAPPPEPEAGLVPVPRQDAEPAADSGSVA